MRKQIKLLEYHAGFQTDLPLIDVGAINIQTIDNQLAAGNHFQLIDTAQ